MEQGSRVSSEEPYQGSGSIRGLWRTTIGKGRVKMSKAKLASIERLGINVKGKREIIAHLSGQKLSRAASMAAKCYDCMVFFADGRQDCEQKDCPLYQYNTSGVQFKTRERKKPTSTGAQLCKKRVSEK
jgi:hypothetical protein